MIRPARPDDAQAIARLHREVLKADLPYLPALHSPAEDLRYFTRILASGHGTWVAEADGALAGYACISPGWVDHLYVRGSAQGQGIGTALLERAIADAAPRALWTFQRNRRANRFYHLRGWTPVEHTGGDRNEEREPDTRYIWPGPPPSPLQLVTPGLAYVAGFIAALNAGWSPSSERDTSADTRAELEADPAGFLRQLALGEGTVTIADGTRVKRIPGRVFWLWDGGFCGTINVRHMPGTEALPAHVSGHVGYGVVPWRRRRGYATRALATILPYARALGLPRVLLTCDEDNIGSRHTIEANGGVFAGPAPPHKRTYWIDTGAPAQAVSGGLDA